MLPSAEFGQPGHRYPEVQFPDFDPLVAGVEARVVFLLEKPGSKASRNGGGSGFTSATNDELGSSFVVVRDLHDWISEQDVMIRRD